MQSRCAPFTRPPRHPSLPPLPLAGEVPHGPPRRPPRHRRSGWRSRTSFTPSPHHLPRLLPRLLPLSMRPRRPPLFLLHTPPTSIPSPSSPAKGGIPSASSASNAVAASAAAGALPSPAALVADTALATARAARRPVAADRPMLRAAVQHAPRRAGSQHGPSGGPLHRRRGYVAAVAARCVAAADGPLACPDGTGGHIILLLCMVGVVHVHAKAYTNA